MWARDLPVSNALRNRVLGDAQSLCPDKLVIFIRLCDQIGYHTVLYLPGTVYRLGILPSLSCHCIVFGSAKWIAVCYAAGLGKADPEDIFFSFKAAPSMRSTRSSKSPNHAHLKQRQQVKAGGPREGNSGREGSARPENTNGLTTNQDNQTIYTGTRKDGTSAEIKLENLLYN